MKRNCLFFLAAGAVALPVAWPAWGAPYASGVVENGGNIAYTLNEPADNVTILRDGVGASLGALGRGQFSVGRQGAGVYSLVVTKNSSAGYLSVGGVDGSGAGIGGALVVSDDANLRNSFWAPRGVGVNVFAGTGQNFGRVYVSNAATGTTLAGQPTPVRATGDGLYVNRADGSDVTGQGNSALSAGINWGTGGIAAPWRVAVDEAGFLYVADFSDANGSVFRATASATTGANLLTGLGASAPLAPTAAKNHGSVGGIAVSGSAGGGNLTLWTVDEDLTPVAPAAQQLNSAWRYQINGGTSGFSGVPVQVVSGALTSNISNSGITTDIARDRVTGRLFLSQMDGDGDKAGVVVADGGGAVIFSSLAASVAMGMDGNIGLAGVQDVLRGARGIDVSPDGRRLAVGHDDGRVSVVPLIDGVPDLANVVSVSMPLNASDPNGAKVAAANRDVAFDAAGNIWVINSFEKFLRAISPGGPSVTTLSVGGANGAGAFSAHIEPTFLASSGSYSVAGNWAAGVVPNSVGAIGRFIGGTVTVDSAVTLGTVVLEGSAVVGGSGGMTLASLQSPRVLGVSGNGVISAPLVLTEETTVGVWQGASVTISSALVSADYGVVKAGRGGLGFGGGFDVAGLTVNGGRVEMNGDGRVEGLEIAAGAVVDLNVNELVVDYAGPSVIASVIADLLSGRIEGASEVGGLATYVGIAEAGDLGLTEFAGFGVDETAVVLKVTYVGDANLDGQVDALDYERIDLAIGNSGVLGVAAGDLNYDGNVDALDYEQVDLNIGNGVGAPLGSVLVPEPGVLSLIAVGGIVMMRRRMR